MNSAPGTLLYRTSDFTEAAMLRIELEGHGVPAVQAGENAAYAMGGFPSEPFYSEIWVPKDRVADAVRIVEACHARTVASASAAWTCESCGESNEDMFAVCWKCLTYRAPAG